MSRAVVAKFLMFQANVVIYQDDRSPEFPDVTACKINPYSHPWHEPQQPTFDQYFNFVRQLKADVLKNRTLDRAWNIKPDNVDSIFTMLESPNGYFSNIVLSQNELDVSKSTMVIALLLRRGKRKMVCRSGGRERRGPQIGKRRTQRSRSSASAFADL